VNTRLQGGVGVVFTVSGGMVLADGPTGNAEQEESLSRTLARMVTGPKVKAMVRWRTV